MTEETNKPSIETVIDEQAQLIVSLQGLLKTAIGVGIAEDIAYFAQAVLAATQTWALLVEALDGNPAKPSAPTVFSVAKTDRGQP